MSDADVPSVTDPPPRLLGKLTAAFRLHQRLHETDTGAGAGMPRLTTSD